MSHPVRISQVGEYLSRHVVDVFGALMGLPAVLSKDTALPNFPQRVSGVVGFTGEKLTGTIYIHTSEAFARCAAAAMRGLSADEKIHHADVNEVVIEISRLVTGGLKLWFSAALIDCGMSLPTIIRGSSFAVESIADVEREVLVFDCAGEQVGVEIHLKSP